MAREDDTQLLAQNETDAEASANSDAAPEALDVVSSAESALAEDEIEAQLALKNLEERRAKKRRSKRIKILLACLLVAAVLAATFGRKYLMPQSNEEEIPPETYVVERGEFEETVTSSGALKAGSTVVVTPEVDGIIEEIHVTEGQQVQQGDVLFTLRNDSLDKAVREAEEDVRSAQQGVSSAENGVAQANAARDEAWNRYYEDFSEADQAHMEWQYLHDNYDQLHAQWERDMAAAEKVECVEPIPPTEVNAPEEPSADATEDEKQAYNKAFTEYQKLYSEYLAAKAQYDKDLVAYQTYQELLLAAGEEPQPAGVEPTYPDAPEDSSLVAAIESAQEGVTSAYSALNKANEAYNEAVEMAGKRVVKAPTSGNVVAVGAKVGEAIGGAAGGTGESSRGPLVQISDINKMAVDIEVNEIDILGIKSGQDAKVTFSAVPGVEVDAQVTEVATVATNGGEGGGVATFHVSLVIPKPDAKLRPGMTANVKIYLAHEQDVLLVPTAAISDGEAGTTVRVVVDPETLNTEMRTVKVGSSNTSESVIEDGLVEGETLLVSGGSVEDIAMPEEAFEG